VLDRINLEEADKSKSESLSPDSTSSLPAPYLPTLPQVVGRGRRVLFSPWCAAALLLAVVALFLAYLFTPVMRIKLGGGYDRPYLNLAEGGFGYAVRFDYDDGQSLLVGSESETNGNTNPSPIQLQTGPEAIRENYRWTRTRPILLLPGPGELARLELRAAASPVYPAGQEVQILLNGQDLTTFALKPGLPKLYTFDLTKYPYQSGNLAVEMRVKPLGLPDSSIVAPTDGFKLYEVWLTPKPGSLPPLGLSVSLLVVLLCFYFALAYPGLPRPWAFGATALLLVLATAMLIFWRLELTVYTGRLALLLVVTALALPLLDLTLPRLFQLWQLPLPRQVWSGLVALFLIGLLLRGGGVLYPQAVIIDAPAHLLEINRITQGQLWEQYTNRNLSKVPGQWNSAAVIPYSTISYFLLAPFALLPLDPNISINLVNIFLDAVRVFILYALALALGAGIRAALVAAGLYLLIPCTWLMNSWGNWPTTLSFWLALLYLTLALVLYSKLSRWQVWLSLTVLLTLTMLVYSVTAVFMAIMLYSWAVGLFFFVGRADKLNRQNAKAIFASTTVAGLAAVVLYYWQFLSDIATTLTSFDQSLSSGEGLGLGKRDFLPYLGLYTDHLFNLYGVGALLGLALIMYGWISFAPVSTLDHLSTGSSATDPSPTQLRSGRNLWLMGIWLVIFVVFGLLQWKVDMVDKQVWFTVPLISVLASLLLLFIWQKLKQPVLFYGGRLAIVALTGWLTYSTVSLWIYRIFFKRH